MLFQLGLLKLSAEQKTVKLLWVACLSFHPTKTIYANIAQTIPLFLFVIKVISLDDIKGALLNNIVVGS
jgi:hypothetical protein